MRAIITFRWAKTIFFYSFFFLSSFSFALTVNEFNDFHLKSYLDTALIENEFVTVHKNETVFNNANDIVIQTRVIVALSKLKIKSSRGIVRLHRGEIAVFFATDFYTITTGEFFEIGIKTNHPNPLLPEIWYEPLKNKVIFENQEFRVFEERLGAHEDRALHSHLQRVVVRLNKVQLTDPRYYKNGQEGKGIQEPNTVKYALPTEHVVRNLSGIPLFNIVLEFKHR